MIDYSKSRIAVIGLGYVGLPLAVAFSRKREVLGFDIDSERVEELSNGVDRTLEIKPMELKNKKNLVFSNNEFDLDSCRIFIVTVPTPIDSKNKPDLKPLISASSMLAKFIKKGSLIIFESTVYPGATEEVCVPALEEISGLKFNLDFFCGYSPERINPGDRTRNLESITKVVSGSNEFIADEVDKLYSSIIEAGTFKVSSIKIAEAAKVIENTQRDLNIALINELSILFNKLGLDTSEILEAAETKWNFVPFKPGLVGGHCIGIDPYYLTHKAQEIGFEPEVILAGRKINDSMSTFIVDEMSRKLSANSLSLANSKILILGFSFKENCRDIRNTKVADIVKILESRNSKVEVYDPWIDVEEAKDLYNIDCLRTFPSSTEYSAILIAVAHKEFRQIKIDKLRHLLIKDGILYDVKSIFSKSDVDGAL